MALAAAEKAPPSHATPALAELVDESIDAPAGVVAPVAGLIAAWFAAGSAGLLGHPLQHALVLLLLGAVVVAAWPDWRRRSWSERVCGIAGLGAALWMSASSLPPVHVMASAVVLAAVAILRPDANRALRTAALAVAIFGVYRLANTSIPSLWLATDWLGGALGRVAGWISGEPLTVGATFGGVDFLVLIAAVYALWLIDGPPSRWRFAGWGAAGILVAQLIYLGLLSEAPNALAYLTAKPDEAEWFRKWVSGAAPWKELLPWNVPILGAVAQAAIAALMFHRMRYSNNRSERLASKTDWRAIPIVTALAGLAAALLPIATVLAPFPASLETERVNPASLETEVVKKRVVAYEKGFLNWEKPVHGNYGSLTVGMYGMFGPLVESLGGDFKRSPDLSDKDLADADLLVLFYPMRENMTPKQVDRVRHYVEHGGKLLLMSEHTIREKEADDKAEVPQLLDSRFNELLADTSMRVPFDAAEFATQAWRESYEGLAHPTTAGIGDDHNQFGVIIGASVDARWPARPILIGRWGWCDQGDEGNGATMALLGNLRYDPGERLGDVVLAAEQPLGNGRIMVFGDTSSLCNGVTGTSYPFMARVLAYMAGDGKSTQSAWRQALGSLLALIIVGLLFSFRPTIWRAAVVAAALSASLAICVSITAGATEVLPSGQYVKANKPNNLAYIDIAHLGTNNEAADQPEGTFGLEYALMRDDMLALSLYDLTYERLRRAGLFISIGPQRPFTRAERAAIRRFMEEDGGIFILMAGYERSAASESLLRDFDFTVGALAPGLPEGTEPTPLGHFKSGYLPSVKYKRHRAFLDLLAECGFATAPLRRENAIYLPGFDPVYALEPVYVRFNAAWPVTCKAPDAEIIAEGIADRPFDATAGTFRMEGNVFLPVIIVRPVGKGKMVVIGDTDFASNKNLENKDGTPIEGLRENADFWRWFLAKLRGLPEWKPPSTQPTQPAPAPEMPAPNAPGPDAAPPQAITGTEAKP